MGLGAPSATPIRERSEIGNLVPQRFQRRIQFLSTLKVTNRTLDIAPPELDIAQMDQCREIPGVYSYSPTGVIHGL